MPFGRSARRGMIVGAALSSSRSRKAAAQQQAGSQTAATPANTSGDDIYVQLEKLGALKEKGILTQAEFDAKKKQILGI